MWEDGLGHGEQWPGSNTQLRVSITASWPPVEAVSRPRLLSQTGHFSLMNPLSFIGIVGFRTPKVGFALFALVHTRSLSSPLGLEAKVPWAHGRPLGLVSTASLRDC